MRQKSRITAAILSFFFGIIGLHKLYLGKVGGFIGFMILLVISTKINFPLTLIFGVISGIKFLNMSDQEFNKKYNRGYIPAKRGQLEVRREEQMRKYEQVPQKQKSNTTVKKPSPQMSLKVNTYKNSGIKKYKDFDLEDAILDFKKGLELAPNDIALNFNIACAYSLTEKKELAYHHLQLSVKAGMKDVERILSHDDLAYVRIQPEFEAFKASAFLVNPMGATSTHNQDNNNPTTVQYEEDDTLLAQLNKLSELRNNGKLTDDEFLIERKKILRQ